MGWNGSYKNVPNLVDKYIEIGGLRYQLASPSTNNPELCTIVSPVLPLYPEKWIADSDGNWVSLQVNKYSEYGSRIICGRAGSDAIVASCGAYTRDELEKFRICAIWSGNKMYAFSYRERDGISVLTDDFWSRLYIVYDNPGSNPATFPPLPDTFSPIFNPNAGIDINLPTSDLQEVVSDTINSYADCMTPAYSGIDFGAYTVYAPTVEQLGQFTNWLWSADIDRALTGMLSNPMDMIISSHFLPVSTANFNMGGNVELRFGIVTQTGINMPVVFEDFCVVDMGEVIIPKVYDSFLDANPNTQVEIFIPFCGAYPLDADLCVGVKMRLEYALQISTGICVARVYTAYSVNGAEEWSLLLTADGNMRQEAPMSSNQQLTAAITGTVGAGAGVALTAGALLGGAGGAMVAAGVGLTASGLSNVANDKYKTKIAGNPASNAGWLSCKTPYIKVSIPKLAITENYSETYGYQSNLSVDNLTDLQGSGFGMITVTSADLSTNIMTAEEWQVLKDDLAKGVIF